MQSLWRAQWGDAVRQRFAAVNVILDNKFYFDWINENILARAARALGTGLWVGVIFPLYLWWGLRDES